MRVENLKLILSENAKIVYYRYDYSKKRARNMFFLVYSEKIVVYFRLKLFVHQVLFTTSIKISLIAR